jgi:hypothetical protein
MFHDIFFQYSLASVEMSSSFSVCNFSTNQVILNNAARALKNYLTIGFIWAAVVGVLMYFQFGVKGLIIALLFNALIMLWMWWSYSTAFKHCCRKHNLEYPCLWFGDNICDANM